MSHFTEIKVNFSQKCQADLVAALEEQFGKGHVEVHDGNGSALHGYQGDNRANLSPSNSNYAPPCHIIIRKQYVGGAANDVGYRKNEDGTYTAYISDYDKRGNFNQEKQDKVAVKYTELVTERRLKQQGYTVKKVYEQGKLVVIGSKYD